MGNFEILLIYVNIFSSSAIVYNSFTLFSPLAYRLIHQIQLFLAIPNCGRAFFSRADTNGIINGRDKNLAIADIACSAGPLSCFQHSFYRHFANNNFHLHLGEQIDRYLGAAVHFLVSSRQTATVYLTDSHSCYPDCVKRFFQRFQPFRTGDNFNLGDFIHCSSPFVPRCIISNPQLDWLPGQRWAELLLRYCRNSTQRTSNPARHSCVHHAR